MLSRSIRARLQLETPMAVPRRQERVQPSPLAASLEESQPVYYTGPNGLGVLSGMTTVIDLYSYVGTEQVSRASFNAGGKPFGYGNPNYSNAGCTTELSPLACVGNTSGLTQDTLGAWWRFLKGGFGTLQVGGQHSYTQRTISSALVPQPPHALRPRPPTTCSISASATCRSSKVAPAPPGHEGAAAGPLVPVDRPCCRQPGRKSGTDR